MTENTPARFLARNVRLGSGNHGLTEDQLYEIFKHASNVDQLAYSLKKCAELNGKGYFVTQEQTVARPPLTDFTAWHHIDEQWNSTWGFPKATPGCYVYGVFEQAPTVSSADFLGPEVIYIGESRAVTRNCMLGRRTDFKGTVRNERLSPYGCGTAFKENFGKDKIDNCYQAYLPMHPSFCKHSEIELLGLYYQKYNSIPVCNPPLDLVRVKKYLKEKENE
jgi:hypothetical protein